MTTTGQYGKLWSKGHETLINRRIIAILPKSKKSTAAKNTSATTTFLQGLITSDLHTPPPLPRPWIVDPTNGDDNGSDNNSSSSLLLRSTCFLDHRGRVLTDALLWNVHAGISSKLEGYLMNRNFRMDLGSAAEQKDIYLIDVPENSADTLIQHLVNHKLRRSAVEIMDVSDLIGSHTIYGTRYSGQTPSTPDMDLISSVDPRHPSVGLRLVSVGHAQNESSQSELNKLLADSPFPSMQGSYELIRRLAGIAEGDELLGKTALETNQEWLNAVSFKKGCYLGQELTARSNFKGTVRKRIMPVFLLDRTSQIPWQWATARKHALKKLVDEDENEHTINDTGNPTNPMRSPCGLPFLSTSEAGSIMANLLGHSHKPIAEIESQEEATMMNMQREQDQRFLALTEQLVDELKPGNKLINSENGKVIGDIVAPPVAGTSVVLAQMRLDNVIPKLSWKEMNQVRVQNSDNDVLCDHLRYMPYMPLWWPRELDEKTGKELQL